MKKTSNIRTNKNEYKNKIFFFSSTVRDCSCLLKYHFLDILTEFDGPTCKYIDDGNRIEKG